METQYHWGGKNNTKNILSQWWGEGGNLGGERGGGETWARRGGKLGRGRGTSPGRL